jgi:hypothetical protein
MNIRYFASRTSNGKENLFQYFYWKIAKLQNCKIGQPLNFDFQGMTKAFDNLKSTNQLLEVISILSFQLHKFPTSIRLNQNSLKSFKDSLQIQIWLLAELRTIIYLNEFSESCKKTSKDWV